MFNGLIVLNGWRNVLMGKEAEGSSGAKDNGYIRKSNKWDQDKMLKQPLSKVPLTYELVPQKFCLHPLSQK